MKINIPHFSQNGSEIPENFRKQACGISCVKMIIDYYTENKDSVKIFEDNVKNLFENEPKQKTLITDLIAEGQLIKAFDESLKYWTHNGLVKILRNHGILAYSQEFKTIQISLESETVEEKSDTSFLDKGIKKIVQKMEQGNPVIISVSPNFSDNKDNHLVIVSGVEKESAQKNLAAQTNFYITDPLIEEIKLVGEEELKNYWRRLAIFID